MNFLKLKNITSPTNRVHQDHSSEILDGVFLCILTGLGLFGNLFVIGSILIRKSLRKVGNMFLLHHCFINLIQCLLFIPFIMALLNEQRMLKGCEILGGTFVTIVTATVLNIAAMTASEAYRFEDLVQQKNEDFHTNPIDQDCEQECEKGNETSIPYFKV